MSFLVAILSRHNLFHQGPIITLLVPTTIASVKAAAAAAAMTTTRTIHLKKTIDGLYQPHRKHEALFTDHFKAEWVHPDLLKLVERCQKKPHQPHQPQPQPHHPQQGVIDDEPMDPTLLLLAPMLQIELPGAVYSFQAFSSEFLQLFNEEMDNFYHASADYQIPIRRPNSMNNYGIVVNEIGLRPLLTSFQQDYIWPLARHLFPQQASQFDNHHSFIVRYQADEDVGLDLHTDDSDVTFNVCVGDATHPFTASTLTFCGMFGAPNHRHYQHTYHHQIGRAVLHLGSQRHGADDIAAGRRVNLIVWNINDQWRASDDYRNVRRLYQREDGPPDEVCLSYTHDVDYTAYKELPERAQKLQLHPWCPPPGKEYEGFDAKIKASWNKKNQQEQTTTKNKHPNDDNAGAGQEEL